MEFREYIKFQRIYWTATKNFIIYAVKLIKSLMKVDYYPPILPEQYHHCVNHAVGNELVFRQIDNYYYFLEKYKQHIAPITTTYAFCLMPNHFHFLIKIKTERDIIRHYQHLYPNRKIDELTFNYAAFTSQVFGNFFNAYAKAYNKKYNRRGTLFETPFKRSLITSESHFLSTLRYIHQNPVRHGFTGDIAAWEFSSYHAYLNPEKTGAYKSEILRLFNGLEDFITFHNENEILEGME
jgi:REP element-mobilizing transposase RayT